MSQRWRLKLEKRDRVSRGLQSFALLIASGVAVMITAALIAATGTNVAAGFGALWSGAFGSWRTLLASLTKSTPLILTGLATVVAFRARVWNIGQEGQLYAGAILSYWAYRAFQGQPPAVLIIIVIAAALLGGAACGLIAGAVKVAFGVDEIITTIMLNYLIGYLLSWLLSNPWRDPNSYYQHSPAVSDAAQLPILVEGSRLHLGFLVAIVAALALYVLVKMTPLGFEIRAFGLNSTASQFQGTDVRSLTLLVMLISGAVAGLAGGSELFGIHHRLKADISLGYGYTGIIIAMVASLNPVAVLPAAILFGGLINGSLKLQTVNQVPAALVYVIQAVVLLSLLTARAITSYRIRRVQSV